MHDTIKSSIQDIRRNTLIVVAATPILVIIAVCILAGTITRPIIKMTSAARSIANNGANTDVFGGAIAGMGSMKGGRMAGSANGSDRSRRHSSVRGLLHGGNDEITLGDEFQTIITGLGERGSAARAIGLEDTSVYPDDPFTSRVARVPRAAAARRTPRAT